MFKHDVRKAMVGGLLGTLLQATLVYAVAPMITGRSMDMAAMLEPSCILGMLIHLLSGAVIFPLWYVSLPSHWLPGSAVVKGMLWAGLIWFVAESIMAPIHGAEVFSAELGGLSAALRALFGYLVYGAVFGSIVGTTEPEGLCVSRAL
jgi:hypothetical protein